MLTLRKLINTIKKDKPKADLTLVELAYQFANQAHKGQKRFSGEPYIQHSLHTAQNLAELKMPIAVIIAGLLHDVPEDTEKTIDDVRKEFGSEIATLVQGITKLSKVKYRGMERYAENLRKMFVAMAQDIRVIIIKFADRLHNLQTLYVQPANKQKRIALESLDIYAPIANRLGMGELQARLEDTSFKYAYPEEFSWVENLIKKTHTSKEKTLKEMIILLKKKLRKENISFLNIYGRSKHYYSLYRKLLRFNKDINQIYDLVAIRIIVDDIADCYATLGSIHNIWRPIKGRIKDYIAQPKPNGYQSLHTTVFGANKQIVEFQIRTKEMHEQAEYGIAAHWWYKEKNIKSQTKQINWVQDLAEWLKNLNNDEKFLEKAKIDVFQNRIFVFTPKGDVIDLPDKATPVDFAYHIHSDLGDKCSRALVNNVQVSLDKPLKNGDMVQIIIDKNRKGPNPEWLKFVKTRAARHKITTIKNKKTFNLLNFKSKK